MLSVSVMLISVMLMLSGRKMRVVISAILIGTYHNNQFEIITQFF